MPMVRGRGRGRGRPPNSSYVTANTPTQELGNAGKPRTATVQGTPNGTTPTAGRGRGRGRGRVQGGGLAPAVSSDSPREVITFNEDTQTVYFDVAPLSASARVVHSLGVALNINDKIPIISASDYDKLVEDGVCPAHVDLPPEPHIKLPEASVKEIKDYSICDAPTRPNAYIRFIEKSAEELDGEVEYDVDEEDTTWLAMINEKRQSQGVAPVAVDSLELLMDRLEKESFFQAAANGQSGAVVDDDAVCCICMDGECQNTNVILFCDMCNLAVHQDCYGVPYIPEGQWLCRRCLQSPSRPVDCVLCPNKGGAFKQTDRNQWAHVVCALWIPEVRFANTVFLEPIDSIETIPAARWRLCCYICKQKGVGACIQCHRGNCYAAFHVTCAQQAGLHMRMDTVRDSVTGNETQPIIVQKLAFCDAHTPPKDPNEADSDGEKAREASRNKMKLARKMLAKKRTSVPVILIPTIPADRIQEIGALVNIAKKATFIQRLIAYWTLKRHYRNGVPLLRRLQSSTHSSQKNGIEGSPDASELYQQLKYWQSLRQDLERARLLCELVRKREKLKLVWLKTHEQHVMMEINPVDTAMHKLLEAIMAKDTTNIFREPVDVTEVPDYVDIVKHPMDLSTMRNKLETGMYYTLDDLEADFDLMIRNCLAYNNRDTVYYRAGVRMRDQCAALFTDLRRQLETDGLIQPKKTDDIVGQEIDEELKQVLQETPSEKTLVKLQILYERAVSRHGLSKTKRVRVLKVEITKMKKAILKTAPVIEIPDPATSTPASQMVSANQAQLLVIQSQLSSDDVPAKTSNEGGSVATTSTPAKEATNNQTPPCSPIKSSVSNSASPSGVNRRTAVLFTRKAQAALKKPEASVKEEVNADMVAASEKVKPVKKAGRKPGRPSRKSVEALEAEKAGKLSPQKSPIKEMMFESIPESFRNYRSEPTRDVPGSDDSDVSFGDSTSCSSCSGRSTGSDYDSSFDDDDDDENSMCSGTGSENYVDGVKSDEYDDDDDDDDDDDEEDDDDEDGEENDKQMTPHSKPLLQPLQLVWAKTRGYPWYPALIIDPSMPKGFVNNGVPLPVPPTHVLEMRKRHKSGDSAFLILFFDPKRTWQWLPATKLELLGIDKVVDQSKLIESKKPQEKKAVKKAYQQALHYQSQVSEAEAKVAASN